MSTASKAQTQKGTDIDGEAADDRSGYSVSMPDAYTVAIGAHYNDGNGLDAGQVRVYSWNGNAWIQKGIDIDGEAANDLSGFSVCMADSNTVAIGAIGNSGNGSNAGQVRIYKWNGNMWSQKGSDIDGETSSDGSGASVSMPDSNTVAIGAIYNDGNGTSAGQVRVFTWNGNAWIQKGIDIDGEAANDQSGFSVSMPDSNTVAIGANQNTGNGFDAGHTRIYAWNGSAWIQKGSDIDAEAANNYAGWSVNMPDSNTVAIGAVLNSDNGTYSGHVRVYSWNGSSWVQKGADIDGEATYDASGSSVSMPDANTVAIGAIGNGGSAGHVRIYSWNGSVWIQRGIDIDGEAGFDESGISVSMPDRNTVAIGAHKNSGNGTYSGHVRIYCLSSAATVSVNACGSYISPSNNYVWTSSGTYLDTISNTSGCDSLITINLSIDTVNASVTNTSPVLTANAAGAVFQWVDCNNGFTIINGATNQSYTATANGSYAVIVTQNNCSDTSACEAVINMSVVESNIETDLHIFPNPTDGKLTIDLGSINAGVRVIIRNALGQEMAKTNYESTGIVELHLDGEPGIYFIEISTADNNKVVLKVIKE